MWLELLDGPAKGQYRIKSPSAPRVLRATTSPEGVDVLDAFQDKARPEERVHGYRVVRGEHRLDRERKDRSGAWAIYEYIQPLELVIYTDGGNLGNPGPAACAAVVLWKQTEATRARQVPGELIVEASESIGVATNNEAEYRGLMLGARIAKICGATHVDFVTDSELMARQLAQYAVMVVGQSTSTYAVRDPKLVALHNRVVPMLDDFIEWKITAVRREQNRRADWLCNTILRPYTSKVRKLTEQGGPIDC
jgi:ribonuclease HI